ncbi:hypothetical protein JAK59_16180 [Stenotrophomonas maltophilia]|uniref:hypothetical protein n=2 Tax=Stenotrophomonas TaxID=40323 RepID=UPI000B4D30FF|nr:MULTISPECIES: hypothetical protein [Stenotrophomonas]MCU1006581.1 hypothetical protein [Stenotrophomonas maltophilia]OWQ70990.1 hypothetical protein CEE57_11585 [Stenotrophomonas maltophilia]PJL07333.1 hypothetical protein B9Y63_09075 [Stenotrophomonas maltophilia]
MHMFLLDHSKEIASLLAPVLTATFGWLSKGRARLLCAQRHGFTFYIPPEADSSGQQRDAITVHTISYFIRNDGKIPLNGVEVVWQWKPDGMHLWPPRPFSQEQTHDGRHVVGIKSLAPGEDFLVEVIGFGSALPQMQSCRSEQAVARHVELNFYEKLPAWRYRMVRILTLAGIAGIAYAVLLLLQIILVGSKLVTP